MYRVKEIFYTLQGEGSHAGRASVFCRFTSCNLWTGRDQDRARAVCKFCDTDFVGTDGPGGGRFDDADALADAIASTWQGGTGAGARPWVVCTGGEPLLQLDEDAVNSLHSRGFGVAIETNGTMLAPAGVDWICVSPKANAPLVLTSGHDLKLVYPQVEPEADPDRFIGLDFERFLLQPLDGPDREANTKATIAYCLSHPRWELCLQTHKYVGIA
ncbi:MAG: 7-carboxy-7-deazaguanine synthase [Jatrophihabitantaceae bacterium]